MPEVTIPVGPQHPALKEPVNFKVTADGEKITGLELNIAYNHRGIEKAAEQRNFSRSLPLLERVCGICSHSHATVFAKGIEEVMGLDIPKRAQYIRTVIAELERMHSHLLWLGVAAHEVGFNALFMWAWSDREAVEDILEEMTGNRVNYGMNEIGGVRRDLSPAHIKLALTRMEHLVRRVEEYADMVNNHRTMLIRFKGVGKISKKDGLRFGIVGPTARASGIDYDIRKDDPYLAYGEIPWKVITDPSGDVYGRILVRVGEMRESLGMIRYCLENLPEGPIRVPPPKTAPAGELLSRYEAPRGELCHYMRTNGTDKVDRLDIRTPTMANWTSVAVTLVGSQLADLPVIIAAIDPCLSCTSRITLVDESSGETGTLSWEELRRRAIRKFNGDGEA